MTIQSNFFKSKTLLIMLICLAFSMSAFAAGEKNHLLIIQNLSEKLQDDLATKNVRVKLNKVEELKISNSEVELTGDAICILTNDNRQLPIRFDAKMDVAKQNISNISYDFVIPSADYNPTNNEEMLMKVLMSKISQDYKTENIVIALDSVENVANINGEKKFLGIGEVRVGGMVWNQIKFDVVMDAKTQKANKIVYKIE